MLSTTTAPAPAESLLLASFPFPWLEEAAGDSGGVSTKVDPAKKEDVAEDHSLAEYGEDDDASVEESGLEGVDGEGEEDPVFDDP